MNFIKVKKINTELKALELMLNSKNISLSEIQNDNDIKSYIKEQLGIDISSIQLNLYQNVLLDIDKILAIGDIEYILGSDNSEDMIKGFAVWFDYDAKHCWYLIEDNYEELINRINYKKLL